MGETVSAEVDAERRAHTMRNHTGTHLLHRALRNVVGERARQAGSLVTPDYLRFDFPFDRGLTRDETRAIEDEVRRIIRDDRPVSIAFMPMADAIEGGADAFFDEKYGETVRTIRVQDYSFELCGGTHCRASGQIGGFVITGERSIGSGMRRIEAVTGAAADALNRERLDALERAAEAVGAQGVDAVPDRIAALQEELREAKRRLKAGGGDRPADAGRARRGCHRGPTRRPTGGGGHPVRVDGRAEGRRRATSARPSARGSSRSCSTRTSRSCSWPSRTISWGRGSPPATSSPRPCRRSAGAAAAARTWPRAAARDATGSRPRSQRSARHLGSGA